MPPQNTIMDLARNSTSQDQRPVISQPDPMKQRMALALMGNQPRVRNWGDAASNLVRNMVAAKMMKEGGGPGGGNVKLPTGMMMGQDGKPAWIPGYLEGRRSVSRAGAPVVQNTIDTSGGYAQAYDKGKAGKNIDFEESIYANSGATQKMANQYSQIEQLLLNDNTYTGLGEAPVEFLKRFGADFLGIPGIEGLPQKQMAEKIQNELIGTWRERMGDSRMSDADLKIYKSIPPNPGDSKEAIALQAQMMREQAEFSKRQEVELDRIKGKTGGRLTPKGRSEFRAWMRNNSGFSEDTALKAQALAKQKGKRVSPYAGMPMRKMRRLHDLHVSGQKQLSLEEARELEKEYARQRGSK